jgi:hypothetical protein
MATKESLVKNFKECLEGARSEESQKRYRNAIELYYKAVVALCDILIFEKEGDIPDYHKQRDTLLEELNGDVNKIRIGLHTIYRQSYYKSDFGLPDMKEMKNAIKTIIALKRPGKDIEELAKKL